MLVFDDRVLPAQVAVRTGSTVTWFNAGSAPRSVSSSDRSFRGFMLRPGARHNVRFTGPDAAGRHGFRVGGRFAGSVVVAGGAARNVRGGSIYRYTVRTAGASTHSRALVLRGVPGNLRSQYTVSGVFPNIEVLVRRVRGTVTVQTVGFPTGELAPRLSFVEASSTPCSLQPPPYPNFGGLLAVAGSSSARGGSVVISASMTPGQKFAYDTLLVQQRARACPGNPRVNPPRLRAGDTGMFAGLPGTSSQGVLMTFRGGQLSGKKRWPGRGLQFPLAQLALGRSFTAMATVARVSPRGNDRYDEIARLTFTRVR